MIAALWYLLIVSVSLALAYFITKASDPRGICCLPLR